MATRCRQWWGCSCPHVLTQRPIIDLLSDNPSSFSSWIIIIIITFPFLGSVRGSFSMWAARELDPLFFPSNHWFLLLLFFPAHRFKNNYIFSIIYKNRFYRMYSYLDFILISDVYKLVTSGWSENYVTHIYVSGSIFKIGDPFKSYGTVM